MTEPPEKFLRRRMADLAAMRKTKYHDDMNAYLRGRLAPSPTGRLHLGNAFAFLMAWLSVRSRGGSLVLRMEDIDPDRSRPEYARGVVEDLRWLGLDWDAVYAQSERLHLYEDALRDLQERGLLYPCFCTRKDLRLLASAPHVGDEGVPYPGTCRNLSLAEREALIRQGRRPCLRLNTAEAAALTGMTEGIAFSDAVLGPQNCSLADCGGDFALRRSDGVFAYQLAVAVDDALMGVTEVARGDDLLLSTPRQILLFALTGRPAPAYAHVPLVHDQEGMRLAKRHKGLELAALRAAGARPEAVVGYLGFLAGFLPRPQRIRPADLAPGFRLEALREIGPLHIANNSMDLFLRF